jgi:hypothetical protein
LSEECDEALQEISADFLNDLLEIVFFGSALISLARDLGQPYLCLTISAYFALTLLAHIFVEISKGFDTHYYIVKLPHLPSLQGPSSLGCTHVLAMCNTTDAYMLMPANVLNLKPLVLTIHSL